MLPCKRVSGASVRSQVALVIGVLMCCLFGQEAVAGKRVALVIGNSAYQNVAPLPNPVRDAGAIADMFKKVGFDVVETRQNLKNVETRRTLNSFFDITRDADIAVVYFAGHGIEIDGTNYIVPVDAVLERDRDAFDEAVSLDRIVQSIEPARQLRLIILDACRENPFAKKTRRTLATRGITRGLARVDPDTPNTLVAFAAKAGSTAEDGSGEHSPFTTSLLKNLTIPGLDLRRAFGRVRDDVMNSTGNRQEPFVSGSLGGADVSLVPAPAVPAPQNSVADTRTDYELAERIGTKEAWDYFIAAHGGGFYTDLAKAQRNKLAAEAKAANNNAARESAPNIAQQTQAAVPPLSAQGKLTIASLNDQVALPPQGAQSDIKAGGPVGPDDVPAPGREPTAKEALDWDKVKDSSDQSALSAFIKRYPNSPLSISAQQRLDVLKRAEDEREAKARAEREAASKAAEEARLKAEQQKADLAAAKKRDEEERKAKAAEAEQMAKAAAAEKKAAEAKQKAEEAERAKVAAEQARVQAEQKKAELAAAKKREADERKATAEQAEQAAKAAAAEKKLAEERRKA
ncbi:MAG: caspase family protein, partial [Proteobacteria bacterium]|nr:caspase family protein [Pseudomonadota bacterium]